MVYHEQQLNSEVNVLFINKLYFIFVFNKEKELVYLLQMAMHIAITCRKY